MNKFLGLGLINIAGLFVLFVIFIIMLKTIAVKYEIPGLTEIAMTI